MGMILVNACEGFLNNPKLTAVNNASELQSKTSRKGDTKRGLTAERARGEGFELCCMGWSAILKAPCVEDLLHWCVSLSVVCKKINSSKVSLACLRG